MLMVSFLVAGDIYNKPKPELKLGVILQSAQMLHKKRMKINNEVLKIKSYMTKHPLDSNNVIFQSKMVLLEESNYQVMHDVGNLRKAAIKLGKGLVVSGDKNFPVRFFDYIIKDLVLDYKRLSKKERLIKFRLKNDTDLLLNYMVIWQHEMQAEIDKDGIFHLYKVKPGGTYLNHPNQNLDDYDHWIIPGYFIETELSTTERNLVKVYYNSETNNLRIWK
jgi:hypothetical protein